MISSAVSIFSHSRINHEAQGKTMDIGTLRHPPRDYHPPELATGGKRNHRYRSDPDYRDRRIAQVKARHRANLASRTYRELVRVRSRIWWQRERIDRWT